jgi:hypothetical protein
MKGHVLRVEPPRLLVHSWDEDNGSGGEVVYELAERGDKVLLTLTNRRLPNRKTIVDVGGGWHTHLEMLVAELEGRAPPLFWAMVAELEPDMRCASPPNRRLLHRPDRLPTLTPTKSGSDHGKLARDDDPGGAEEWPGGDRRRRQVSLGQTVIKPNARKVRRLGDGSVIGGFAGATADAFTLFERLERKLEQHHGQLMRAAVELAKDWRTDKYLRNLEAMMIVADKQVTLILTGNGDVLEPPRSGGDRLGRQFRPVAAHGPVRL